MPDPLNDLESALTRYDAARTAADANAASLAEEDARHAAYWNAEAARAAASAPLADTDGDRDYAEEVAVRAEQDAENASEQAHADLVAETARHLRTLSDHAHTDAQDSVAALAGEVNLRLAPNVHRYELLARQQHTALLAATTAAAIEDTGSYDLGSVADAVGAAYRATHSHAGRVVVAGLADRALAAAIDRVRLAVEEVAQHAADAATQHAIAEHEADLAERDR